MARTSGRRTSRKSSAASSRIAGGYWLTFKGVRITCEGLFGRQPITPNQMARRLWDYVERRGLGKVGPIDLEFREGTPSERRHITRERSARLVALVKGRALARFGRLACQACGFDFAQMYGLRGEGFIEAHHTRPVGGLAKETRMRPEDMALLCSNCHRMIHCRRPWLGLNQLRRLVQRSKRRAR